MSLPDVNVGMKGLGKKAMRKQQFSTAMKDPVYESPQYNVSRSEDPTSATYFLRHVKPYVQTFETFAKGRWLGREILEVLTRYR